MSTHKQGLARTEFFFIKRRNGTARLQVHTDKAELIAGRDLDRGIEYPPPHAVIAAIKFKRHIRLGIAGNNWKPAQKRDVTPSLGGANPFGVWKNHTHSRKSFLKIGQHGLLADLDDPKDIRANALEHGNQSSGLGLGLRSIFHPLAINNSWHGEVIFQIVVGHHDFLGRENRKAKKENPAKNPARRHVDAPDWIRPACEAVSPQVP